MTDVVRSLTSFSWAMTLFGARQLGHLLLAEPLRAARAADAVAEATRGDLGEPLERIFRAGERLQAETVDRVFDLLSAEPPSADALAWRIPERLARTLQALPGQELAGRELANKITAFQDFWYAESQTGLSSADRSPLARSLEKAAALGSYHRLWSFEGLGFAHAERAPASPRGLLRRADALPEARIPLHTGMGLSLAKRALGAADTRAGDRPVRAALEVFLSLCEANAAPGCEMMAFEALGLVMRTLEAHLLLRADRLLTAIDPELVDYYWHGVGRGLYFTPGHAPPRSGAWSRALEKARREPPHEAGRRNALAGFAWAVTLVNLRHPEVLERLLRDHAGALFDPPAFSHGVGSALLLWCSANGRDAYLERFLAHRPEGSVAELWQRRVKAPAQSALASPPEAGGEPAALFRCPGNGRPPSPVADRAASSEPLPRLGRSLDGWLSRALQAFLGQPP